MKKNVLLQISSLVLTSILLLSYNEDPPNGRTGAPFDGSCADCHNNYNPNNFNGIATIIGLPDTIQPNVTYSLQIKATATGGNPVRAGFQLVVVDKNNFNAGNLTATNTESDTEFMNGREYLDQRGGKYFNTPSVSWNFSWTAPGSAACNTIKFYYIVNFCNGSGDFADFPIAFADSVYFAGGPTLATTVATVQNNICLEDRNGIAQAEAFGGNSPYEYLWSNGSTDTNIELLANGTYSVTILDSDGCLAIDSTVINALDSIPPLIICPSSFSVCAGDTVHFDFPTWSDNCGLADSQPILLSGLHNGTIFPLGITEMVFQATDHGGNLASCSFLIEVDSCAVETIHPLENTEKLLIVPNPVRETFFIHGLAEALLSLELINLQGQVVKVLPVSTWPGPFFIADIPDSVYGLRVLFGGAHQHLLLLVKSK